MNTIDSTADRGPRKRDRTRHLSTSTQGNPNFRRNVISGEQKDDRIIPTKNRSSGTNKPLVRRSRTSKPSASTRSSGGTLSAVASCFADDKLYPHLSYTDGEGSADMSGTVEYFRTKLPANVTSRVVCCSVELDHTEVQDKQNIQARSIFAGLIYNELVVYGTDVIGGCTVKYKSGLGDITPVQEIGLDTVDVATARRLQLTLGLNVETSLLMEHELVPESMRTARVQNPNLCRVGGFVALFSSLPALDRFDVVVQAGGGLPWLPIHEIQDKFHVDADLCDTVQTLLEKYHHDVAVLWCVVSVLVLDSALLRMDDGQARDHYDAGPETFAIPLFFRTRVSPCRVPVVAMWRFFRTCFFCFGQSNEADIKHLTPCPGCDRVWLCPMHFHSTTRNHTYESGAAFHAGCGDNLLVRRRLTELTDFITLATNEYTHAPAVQNE